MEVVPRVSGMVALWNPDNPGNASQLRAAEAVSGCGASPWGCVVPPRSRRRSRRWHDSAPMGSSCCWTRSSSTSERESRTSTCGATCRRSTGYRLHADDGGLMAYGASRMGLWKQTAVYVAKILKGARPTDLPVAQPTKFEAGQSALKYFASGWWKTSAETEASGSIMKPSVRASPICSGCSRSKRMRWSARFGQAG
jgi:hypothetical protein